MDTSLMSETRRSKVSHVNFQRKINRKENIKTDQMFIFLNAFYFTNVYISSCSSSKV